MNPCLNLNKLSLIKINVKQTKLGDTERQFSESSDISPTVRTCCVRYSSYLNHVLQHSLRKETSPWLLMQITSCYLQFFCFF